MPDDITGSSPVSEGLEPSPQPAPAAAPAPEPQPPFHEHPRFRELTTQNRELKGHVAQLTQRLQTLEAAQQKVASGQSLNTEEQRQLSEAASALKKIFAADPELRALFEARLHLPRLSQGFQQLTEAQQSSQRESARSHIASLASKEGLPAESKWLAHLTRLVAGAAMSLENGNERFERGDFSVLDEAFEQVKTDFVATLRAAGASATNQAKLKTKGLPPAPRGGQVGQPAPEKPVPGKEREFAAGLHSKALTMLKESLQG